MFSCFLSYIVYYYLCISSSHATCQASRPPGVLKGHGGGRVNHESFMWMLGSPMAATATLGGLRGLLVRPRRSTNRSHEAIHVCVFGVIFFLVEKSGEE